jgi:hypothetical protein
VLTGLLNKQRHDSINKDIRQKEPTSEIPFTLTLWLFTKKKFCVSPTIAKAVKTVSFTICLLFYCPLLKKQH